MTEHIVSWSFSKLQDFEKCKFLTKLKHVDRIPEPERELRPGQTEHANDRGSRVHDAAEHFVRGTGPFIPEMAKFQFEFDHLKRLFAAKKVELEGEWGMDREWETAPWNGKWVECDKQHTPGAAKVVKALPERGRFNDYVKLTGKLWTWMPAWLRLKLDAMVIASKHEAVVIDYKTGRKFGNEIKHAQQLQLYALVTFLRNPDLEVIHAELWYLDTNEITTQTFTREQALRFKRSFDKRGNALTTNEDWSPNPNKFTCQWCLYGPEHSGHCAVGVRKA